MVVARDQIKEGAHVLDVCVDYTGADGVADMSEVMTRTSSAIPVSIQSLAVSRPATPDAHMAVTAMVGPRKPNSWLMPDRTVEGMSWSHSRLGVSRPWRWW